MKPDSAPLSGRDRMALVKEAISICRGETTAQSDRADRLHLRGRLAQRGGQYRVALICFTRVCALDPATAAYVADLADARRLNGDASGAETAYRQAASLDPLDPELQRRLGHFLLRHGDARGALEACERAVRLAADSARARIDLGDALMRSGAHVGAVASYEAAIRLDPTQLAGFMQLGKAWL